MDVAERSRSLAIPSPAGHDARMMRAHVPHTDVQMPWAQDARERRRASGRCWSGFPNAAGAWTRESSQPLSLRETRQEGSFLGPRSS